MNFIRKWSYGCANHLMVQLNESHTKRGVYYYGFQVIIGALVKAVLVIALSSLAGTLLPALIIIGVFGSLRVIAGGYHMDTYGRCIATSLALFIAGSILVQYFMQYQDSIYIDAAAGFSFIFAIVSSIRWAPSDNPNRPITKPEEIRKFKLMTIVYVVVWFLITAILLFFRIGSYKLIVSAGCYGIILEIFTITPAGHKFFDAIKGNINKLKKRK